MYILKKFNKYVDYSPARMFNSIESLKPKDISVYDQNDKAYNSKELYNHQTME